MLTKVPNILAFIRAPAIKNTDPTKNKNVVPGKISLPVKIRIEL